VTSIRVPLLDLHAQYETIRGPLMRAVEETLSGGQWILGPAVRSLEERLASYLSVPHAVGVASGTDALLVSLRAVGCGAGDEVIAPAYSFFATAGAIANVGARPTFVDIDRETYNLAPSGLERAVTSRTRAVIPVHLFGQAADMGPILQLCRLRNLAVIEDAAQAIGATWKNISLGGVGDLGCFSFYPSKNLGGMGDGGLITSRNEELAAKVRMLRVHGSRNKYLHELIGFNSRLDSLQAAILGVKLDYLDGWSQARAAHASAYTQAFTGCEALQPPLDAGRGRHVWNQYVLRVLRGSRDELKEYLARAGVGSEIYYPIPLHMQPCFASLGYREGDLPESEGAARTSLAIPVYPEMTRAQQDHVIDAVLDWARKQ
jgi:dTDP-4-amino-4,6-dideoxygalactose transaminase